MAERLDRSRAGCVEGGQPATEDNNGRAGLVWLQNQPTSTLSRWFHERVRRLRGRMRKTIIVALARKLLVALWRYTTAGRRHQGGRNEGGTGDDLTPSART
jgi:transposase